MRRIIDLSTPIVEGHFRWKVERRLAKSFAEGSHNQATWAGWIVHGFTHIDAPRHMVAGGDTTSEIALDRTVGAAAVTLIGSPVSIGVTCAWGGKRYGASLATLPSASASHG